MAGLLDAVAGALSGGGKAVTGLASGISALLSSKQNSKDQSSNVIYASFGMAGSVGKQRISGRGSLPAAQAKSTYRSENDNTEKLLTDVVRYLVSINSTLKNQIDFDRKVYAENAMAAREAKIEQSDAFNELGKRYGANDNDKKQKEKGGILSTILKALGFIAKLGLSTLFSGFKAAIKAFATAWKWLRALSFLKGIKSLAGLVKSILTRGVLRAAGPIGVTLAILLGLDKFMKDEYDKADKKRKGLEHWGMKAVVNEQGFTEGYTLPDGKTYKADDLPSKYKDILDAYGPNNRGGTSDAARKRIEADPGAYDPDVMAKELKGGEPVGKPAPGATQPASTAPDSAYDIVLGYGRYGKPEEYYNGRKLTQLTVAEVIEFGKNVLQPRSKADGLGRNEKGKLVGDSGVGAYATNRTTIQGAVDAGIVTLDELYDRDAQDRLAKWLYNYRNKQKNLHNTWAYFGKRGQKTSTMTFEEAAPYIMEGEGTSGKKSNSLPPAPDSSGSSNSSSDDLAEKATTAVDGVLTSIADFIGTIGGKIVGPGVSRNLTASGPDFAKLISDESNKIQNEIAMGEKKSKTSAADISSSAQSLRMASPNGSISVINPNYSNGGIDKYLAHFKLAA